MRCIRAKGPSVLATAVFLTASLARADVKVEQQPLGPDGDIVGCAISPHGLHVGALVVKGSRFAVLLDGVEGPKIEGLLPGIYAANLAQVTNGNYIGGAPILFSNDGSHNAYIAKIGDDYVVVEDGKELARGQIVPNGMANISLPLEFSPGGKHLFWMDIGPSGRFRIVVDGKPGPEGKYLSPLYISPDGEHYAYTACEDNTGKTTWAVVDGRQVEPFGDNLQYTARNVIISQMGVDGGTVLLINGKPVIKAASINQIWISPDGAQIAMLISPTNGDPTLLSVDGKVIPDAQGLNVQSLYFSPNGKRWGALCKTKTGSSFMIVDGKKGEEYQNIPNDIPPGNTAMHWTIINGHPPDKITDVQPPLPGFTADSSKFVYVAQQGARQFLLTDEDESDAFTTGNALQPVLSPVGTRVAVLGVGTDRKWRLLLDGKEPALDFPSAIGGTGCNCFNFSPDGSRYAFLENQTLCVDGTTMPGIGIGMQFCFTPDSRHIVYAGTDGVGPRLFLDGKIINDANAIGQLSRILFSPDSQHVCWVERTNLGSMGTKDSNLLMVDGKIATHFEPALNQPVDFEFSSDGVLSFVATTDGNLRLFHVTPSPDASLATLLAAGKTIAQENAPATQPVVATRRR